MSLLKFALFVGSIFWCAGALAGNWFIPATWNQIRAGQFCGQVQDKDVDESGLNCGGHKNSAAEAGIDANQLLHNLVFAEAAKKQLKDDRCTLQALEKILGERRRPAWTGAAVSNWLGLRRSELELTQCLILFPETFDSHDRRHVSLERTYLRGQPDLVKRRQDLSTEKLKEWKTKCTPRTYRILHSAQRLFAHALPVISSPEALALVEENRESIVLAATGKPLTDKDILNMDLRDLSGIRVKSGQLQDAVGEFLNDTLSGRAYALKEIENAEKKGTVQSLDSDIRNYIYEQGTVTQILDERKMIEMDGSGRIKKTTPGANCILAWYEPTMAGELIDFSLTSWFGGSVGLKVAKYFDKTKVGKKVVEAASASKWGKTKAIAGLGMGAVAARDFMVGGYRQCLSRMGKTPRLKDMAKTDKDILVESIDLPEQYGYEQSKIVFDEDEVPACERDKGGNLAINELYRAHCMAEILNIMPPYISLPYMAIKH